MFGAILTTIYYVDLILRIAIYISAAHLIYARFFHPLAHIPGPALARWGIPSWRTLRVINKDLVWRLAEEHKKYGPVIRIGYNEVHCSKSEDAQQIYSIQRNFRKGDFYWAFMPGGKSGLLTEQDPHVYAGIRKMNAPQYSRPFVQELEGIVAPLTEKFVVYLQEQIKKHGDGKRGTVDIGQLFNFFAQDAAGEMGFGAGWNIVSTGNDFGMSEINEKYITAGVFIGTQPYTLVPLLRLISKFTPDPAAKLMGQIGGIRSQRTQDIDSGKHVRRDMLTAMMEGVGGQGRNLSISDWDLDLASATVLSAGSDTVSVLLRFLVIEIVSHPEVYAKVRAELDEAGPQAWSETTVTSKLPYLQACIKETSRLHPATNWMLPRKVGPEGLKVGKFVLPANTVVGASAWIVQRDPAFYGEDAAVFNPERWLVDKDIVTKYDRVSLSFGGGTRTCPGKHIAMMEVYKVIPTIFEHFDISFTKRGPGSPHVGETGIDPETGEKDAKIPYTVDSWWFSTVKDLWVDLSVRGRD